MARATDIVDALHDAAQEGNPVAVERIVDHFDRRSIGAFIMVPALLELTPVGGIPGVPSVIGVIIAIFAAQILIGREDLWLPGFLGRRKVAADKIDGAAEWLRPVAAWADRHFGRHLTILIDPPAPRIAAVAILLLCLTIPPLELVPFASSLPTVTIAAFGLALFMRDGRLMALAWVVMAAALWGGWQLAGPRLGG